MPTAIDAYRNPILPGFNPDPSITHVPGLGYLLVTSSFEYFPGLPIYMSQDLTSWTLVGHAINRRSQGIDMRTVETSAGLWAPTIRYVPSQQPGAKGKIYVACGCMYRFRFGSFEDGKQDMISPNGFFVTSEDPLDDSQWSMPTYFDEQGIDQDLFFDDDGKVYLSVSRKITDPEVPVVSFHHGVYANEIDIGTGRSLTPPVLLRSSLTGTAEGSHIIKKDGWYYLFSAEGGTDHNHHEVVLRSRSPLGPYKEPPAGVNPILFNGGHAEIRNTGHMDVVRSPTGDWFAVFLGVRPQIAAGGLAGGCPSAIGRETFLAPMKWANGWPVVNQGQPVSLVGKATGLTWCPQPTSWKASLGRDALELGWYTLRTPLKPFHSLTDQPDSLTIYGSATRLDTDECPSMLLQKQTHFSMIWSAEVQFEPQYPGQEAGIVVWMSNRSYASIGIRASMDRSGRRELACRVVTPGTQQATERSLELAHLKPVRLRICCEPTGYTLIWDRDESDVEVMGRVGAVEMEPLFTGCHLGLYAQGNDWRPCLSPAHFSEVGWEADV